MTVDATLNSKAVQVIKPLDYAATAPTTTDLVPVDTLGFKWYIVVLHVGTLTGSAGTIDVKMQGSATSGGTYADITGAAFTDLAATDDDTAQFIAIDCHKLTTAQRWVKAHVTFGTYTVSEMGAAGYLLGAGDPAFGVLGEAVI